jgi:DNA replication protein DnaC
LAISIRNRFLSDEDATRLYLEHPELKADSDSYCPTCRGTKTYQWKSETHQCDCSLQLQLYKHYLSSGIGATFQRLTWDDYEGEPNPLTIALDYLENHESYVSRGLGLIFLGRFGTGKTMIATLLLKELILLGYPCYGTTFSSMISMFTSGWKSIEDQRFFQKKLKQSHVLLLDDLGKEFRTKTNLAESVFDDILRSRVQNGFPTFITSNMTPAELEQGYGSAVLSLLREASISHVFAATSRDFREKAFARNVREIRAGEIRPIS